MYVYRTGKADAIMEWDNLNNKQTNRRQSLVPEKGRSRAWRNVTRGKTRL
jgi:hypothetical protein